jgi:hypothetical protein
MFDVDAVVLHLFSIKNHNPPLVSIFTFAPSVTMDEIFFKIYSIVASPTLFLISDSIAFNTPSATRLNT